MYSELVVTSRVLQTVFVSERTCTAQPAYDVASVFGGLQSWRSDARIPSGCIAVEDAEMLDRMHRYSEHINELFGLLAS